jgi:3-phytase
MTPPAISRSTGAAAVTALVLMVTTALVGCSDGGHASAPKRHTAPRLPHGPLPLIRAGAPVPTAGPDGAPAVDSTLETQLFPDGHGDVADDAAIWRDADHPERSLILADDKSNHGGVAVYDLTGRLVQYQRTGEIGNIDLRDEYRIGGRSVILVGANDRAGDLLRFWVLDPAGRTLTSLEARELHSIDRSYGFCLGRSRDHTYAFVSQETSGVVEQYELVDAAGKVDAERVRTFTVGSQAEGCVVDDATGALYVAEEDVGIWRYDIDPASGSRRASVDRVGGGRLHADVEGVSLARGEGGAGVLVASSQGDSTFVVYDLGPPNAFRGSFRVHHTGDVDGVSETDGLAVAAGDFGSSYPNGLLIVHDGENQGQDGEDEAASNLKLVRFDQVIALTPSQ